MMKEQEKNPSSPSPKSCILHPKSFNIADIVVSLNGRDAGKRFIVIDDTDRSYSLIADGKSRRYEKPKRKKNKHLKFESVVNSHITEKLERGEKITNNEIRRFLASYATKGCNENLAENCDEGRMQNAKG